MTRGYITRKYMMRLYLKRQVALFTASLVMIAVLGSFTTDRHQRIDDPQIPASIQKRDAMFDILESLEKNRPYTRSDNWGAPRAFPSKIYMPPIPWYEGFEFDFDFSFAEEMIENAGERIENINFERIERNLEQFGRKIEKGFEKVIKDIERKSTCTKEEF